jgi:hypothetical protein
MTGASVRRVPGMTCGAAAVRCTSTSAGAQLRGCSAHVHGPRRTRLHKIHRPRREIGLQRRILHQRMPGGLRAVGVAFEPHAASEGTLGVAVHCVVHPQALAHDAHVEHGSMPVWPARQWRPTWSVRLKRGSTHTSLALRLRRASMTKRKPTGWFSAGFPPMASTTSALRMSVHPLGIAPRPNVAAKLATVGPCQIRDCCSIGIMPRPARKAFTSR